MGGSLMIQVQFTMVALGFCSVEIIIRDKYEKGSKDDPRYFRYLLVLVFTRYNFKNIVLCFWPFICQSFD